MSILGGTHRTVHVSGGSRGRGWRQGHLVREMETSNSLPQGFWDRDWRGILGRTVSPLALPPSSSIPFQYCLLSGACSGSPEDHYGHRVIELGAHKMGKASRDRDPEVRCHGAQRCSHHTLGPISLPWKPESKCRTNEQKCSAHGGWEGNLELVTVSVYDTNW